jgi:hypothetical protein
MSWATVRALAVSLVLLAAGCGKQSPTPEPAPEGPAAQPNTGRLIVHVKGMTKALNLV